jgi:hypothetical protein
MTQFTYEITAEMNRQITFLSINAGILNGVLERREDKDGTMPDDSTIYKRFWNAYNNLTKEVERAKVERNLKRKDEEIALLREQLQALQGTVQPQVTKEQSDNDDQVPF